MTSNIKRIQWIDYLKGFCMIAIVMTHLSWPEWYARFLSPFELVGFFFVSGYTFNIKSSFREFCAIKIKTLLIPIFIFGLINALLTYIYPGTILKDRLIGIICQIPGRWDDLWFVACLFTMSLIFYPIVRYVNSNVGKAVAVTLIVFCGSIYTFNNGPDLPWQFENACILLPFLYLGYLARRTDVGSRLLNRLRDGKVLICLLIMYVLLICSYDNYPIDVHVQNYGAPVFFGISALLGTLLMTSLSMGLERWASMRPLRWLQYIGQNTLIYYACQSKVITIFVTVLAIADIRCSTYVANMLVALLVCAVLAIPTEIINRCFPGLVGRKRMCKN